MRSSSLESQLTIYQNNISLLNTLLPQNARKSLYLLLQLLIREFLLRLRHRTIPDNRRMISVPRLYMSIHAIVAS